MFVWTCTKKFWQDCRNFVAKNLKTFPIVQISCSYNFLFEFVFIKNDSLAKENALLTTLSKFFLQKTTDLSLRFQKRSREIMNFLEGKLFFLKLWFCTWRIKLRPSCQSFVVKTWKLFARTPERMKNSALSKQSFFSPKCSSEHAQWNFGKPSVTLLPKKRNTFPNSKNVEVTLFWTKLFFSSKMIL